MFRTRHYAPCDINSRGRGSVLPWAFVLVPLLLGNGCGEKKVESAAPGPEVVEVVRVLPQDVPITKEWVATLKGLVNSDIGSEVSGASARSVRST
jgi:hypothetical protein